MALHQTAGFSLASQSAKGTAATTNYIRGRMSTSGTQPRFDRTENTGEHTGIHQRATARQSKAIRTGYIMDVNLNWRLYPYLLGYALIGLGFTVATTADTPEVGAHTHAFTLGDADEKTWMSVIHALGEDTNRYEKLGIDCMLNNMEIAADRTGIMCNATGLGLDEEDAAGTETHTAEPDAALSQANGSFTLTSSDLTAATIGTPRSNNMTFANPQDEEEQDLHSFLRGDLAATGLDITGSLAGLVWSEEAEKEFVRGAAAGTDPVVEIPEADLNWKFQTPGNMSGLSNPHSVEVDIPLVQIRIQPFDVTGGGRVVYSANWEMIDNAASDPITITLVNDHSSYASS